MKKNIKQSIVGQEEDVKSGNQIEAWILLRLKEWETQRGAIGKQTASALRELTSAGVIKWTVEKGWASACVCFRLEVQADVRDEARPLWLSNAHPDGREENGKIFFVLDKDICKALSVGISRNYTWW